MPTISYNLEDLKLIDWEAIAREVLAMLKAEGKGILDTLSEEDKKIYVEALKDYAMLNYKLAIEKDEQAIQKLKDEMLIVEITVESLTSIAEMYLFQKTLNIIGKTLGIVLKGVMSTAI